MTQVRNFSSCGPCIVQGDLVRETAQFYVFTDKYNGKERKLAKRLSNRYSGAHIEPCHSCRDHAQTQYPNGYMD